MPRPSFIQVRTVILLLGGLAGLAHQEFVVAAHGGDASATLVVAYGAMMGLPLFLGRDEKVRKSLVEILLPNHDDEKPPAVLPPEDPEGRGRHRVAPGGDK